MLLRLSLDMVGVDCRPCLLAGAAPREVSGSIGACGWLWTGWTEEAHAQAGVGVVERCVCEMSNLAANGAQITVAWGCGRRFEQVPTSRMSMSIWRYERSPAWRAGARWQCRYRYDNVCDRDMAASIIRNPEPAVRARVCCACTCACCSPVPGPGGTSHVEHSAGTIVMGSARPRTGTSSTRQ